MYRWLFIFIFLSKAIFAAEISQSFTAKDFNEAKSADSYLKFIVESTKVGLFSSDVDGYALAFKASAQENSKGLSQLKVSFPAKSMNTDDSSRDEKLHNLCMSADQYPEVTVFIPDTIPLNGEKQVVDARFTIRGKEKISPLSITLTTEGKNVIAVGKTVISLKEMEIPDPSIAVAKLSDDIRIEFKIIVVGK